MKTVIIDYGSGNLRSAEKATERVAAELGLDAEILVSSRAEDVLAADRVILPGVGAFGDCMGGLTSLEGMREALEEVVVGKGRPFLGICVGMQLMATEGHEHGNHRGLDWLKGTVEPIRVPQDSGLKIPHMGWNELYFSDRAASHPVLAGLHNRDHAYFVHSYYFRPEDPETVLASVDYGGPVTAIVGRDNIIGTQFHPEKSQAVGLRLLGNFLGWTP
ncbi:imidazole glycerol phosphate synthase subunit HisH [Emcibacter nanhaiensis]|uniref:Imidazole glycerol phosphate synthase subunit HisH n=1 Tax=Emcibacter nanhaiensis TaxID=1505037 RepID=A0A501PQ81_9PROT|nr:imidazole glycerol phosphate synthase subunit HisH [Emcibacter nanhaiensis]TPD61861.1 imidazole glycerol phosphate synthase subunit HisH [Emcibacter nanhaiensis]